MQNNSLIIRKAKPCDTNSLLFMMRQLAEFEGYSKELKVTQAELEHRLFLKEDFKVLVAEYNQQLIGMLVYYYLPFTYDLKPWVYIKELYIDKGYRGKKAGSKLLYSLAKECTDIGASKIKWDVLTNNKNAQKFYQSLGSQAEDKWRVFSFSTCQIQKLALKKTLKDNV